MLATCPACGVLPRPKWLAGFSLGLVLGIVAGLEGGCLRWKARGDLGDEWRQYAIEAERVRNQCFESLSFKLSLPPWDKTPRCQDGLPAKCSEPKVLDSGVSPTYPPGNVPARTIPVSPSEVKSSDAPRRAPRP